MKVPDRMEWDFSQFTEDSNPHAWSCYEWEYYREVHHRCQAFQKAVKEWRKNRDPKDDDSDLPIMQLLGESVGRFWFVRNTNWPNLPFQDSQVIRPDVSQGLPEDALREGHGLQIDLQSLPDLQWEHWPAGSVLTTDSDLVAAIHINWTRSQEEIVEQFKQWLRWAKGNMDRLPKPKSKWGNATPMKQAKARLKQLTAMRLLEGRRYKDAAEIFGTTDLYADQAGWINARKDALERIQTMAQEWGGIPSPTGSRPKKKVGR